MNAIPLALLELLKVAPALVANLPQMVELVNQVGNLFTDSQTELQETLTKVQKENDEGFERLDGKLG